MLEFFMANLATIVVGIIVFTIIALVLAFLIRNKINHKSTCGCGCAHCPSAGICHHK